MEGQIRLPLWFEEGVAQLQEASKSEIAHQICRALVLQQRQIPLATLMVWDIRQEKDPNKVKVFYAQSLSVVEFLLKNYGSVAFGDLCRNLKNGKTFEEALRGAYTNNINTRRVQVFCHSEHLCSSSAKNLFFRSFVAKNAPHDDDQRNKLAHRV